MKKNNQYGRPHFQMNVAPRYRQPMISAAVKNSEKVEVIPPARYIFPEEIKLGEYPQPEVLKYHMETAGLTHGQTVMANLKNVRINHMGELYFCPMEGLEIIKRINAGDGGEIPEEVTLLGNLQMKNFHAGEFNLKNIAISSNGHIQVIPQPETTWQRV